MLIGCASQPDDRIREKVASRPPAYQDGYVDGCRSGQGDAANSSADYKKDKARMASDKNYANGWYDAYEECKASYKLSHQVDPRRQK